MSRLSDQQVTHSGGNDQRDAQERASWNPEDLRMFKFLRGVLNHLNIAYVATYPPRECGIATFTRDLATAIGKYTPFTEPTVVAMAGETDIEQYPRTVKLQIMRSDRQSYLDAAQFINDSSIDVVSLQHEYGIFGGTDGDYVLDFLEKLEKPVMTTLHTVLYAPSPNQKRIVQRIAELSERLVVMVNVGRDMLTECYGVPRSKIAVIPHGVPNVHRVNALSAKRTLGVGNRTVISTFGLINRGKGIEYAIQSMVRVKERYPDALYLVLGETHPGVRSYEGESYRKELLDMVADLGLANHVRFNNRYLTIDELVNYLHATDVYVTPYINRDQVVSGALAYALGCGKAIVSTPYIYAQEVLSNGRGMLVDFRDPSAIADSVTSILANPVLREQMESRAYGYARRAAWFNVGIDYLDLYYETQFQAAMAVPPVPQPGGTSADQTTTGVRPGKHRSS